MSNRTKVKPVKLGRPVSMAVYPMVCHVEGIADAIKPATDACLQLAGVWRKGTPEGRVYTGPTVLPVLAELAAASIADPDEHRKLTAAAEDLGEDAALIVVSCKVVARSGDAR